MAFFHVLASPAMMEAVDALSPPHRERLYPPTVALSMFMQRTLDADGSCQIVVNGWAVQRAVCGLEPGSTRTHGYCRAGGRLLLGMVRGLAFEVGLQLHGRARRERSWRGRSVKLVRWLAPAWT
jgi:hypothetical protein